MHEILKNQKTARHSFSPACRQGKLYSFTLIELLVSAACKVRVLPFYYLKIIYKNDTSLRPQGRTSRIFDNGQKCSSHLH
ncbi:MAG: hypothetical protein IKB99_07045, partial [Lentisphaeria bacterium]|nr:hypothetical protein [Lentisphaeria bacterium]